MTTYQIIATKYGVTQDQVKKLQWAIAKTWGVFGYEYMASFDSDEAAAASYGSETSMIASLVLAGDKIKRHSDTDLSWFYELPTKRHIKLAENAWDAS